MKKLITICLVCACLASTAAAHWIPADGHKMHFPQLPDPYGWDIKATTILSPTSGNYLQHNVLADDWLCTQTGEVKDIHFWGSWKNDVVGNIQNIHLSIHKDIPANEKELIFYSTPGDVLWSWDTTDFTVSEPSYGNQGWYDPVEYEVSYPNHDTFYQYNITNIPEPNQFLQQEGTIYWLDITVTVAPADIGQPQPEWGWKTADLNSYPDPNKGSSYRDDAVFFSYDDWYPLYYPTDDPLDRGGQSIDLAFVITPEPATICLLGLSSLSLLRRKK